MRILLVASKYFPSVGGLEKAVYCLNRQFVQAGHETLIVTNRYSRSLAQRDQIDGTGVRRYFFTLGLPKPSAVQIAKYPLRAAAGIPAMMGLKRALREFRPHVVNLHFAGPAMLYCLLALRGSKIPFVLSLHGADVETDIVRSPLRRYLFRKCAKRAYQVTSNSQYLLGKAAEVCAEVGTKGLVVGNGVEKPQCTLGDCKSSQITIACVSRLVPKKGIHVLLAAMQEVLQRFPQARLEIAGDGPEASRLQELTHKLQIDQAVQFDGAVSSDEVSALFTRSAVACVPSLLEPFGIVVLEALAHGVPVVASRAGGIPEVLKDGELGVLVEPSNPDALAEAISRILEHGPAVDTERVRKTVISEFSWSAVANRYLSVYTSAIEHSGAS